MLLSRSGLEHRSFQIWVCEPRSFHQISTLNFCLLLRLWVAPCSPEPEPGDRHPPKEDGLLKERGSICDGFRPPFQLLRICIFLSFIWHVISMSRNLAHFLCKLLFWFRIFLYCSSALSRHTLLAISSAALSSSISIDFTLIQSASKYARHHLRQRLQQFASRPVESSSASGRAPHSKKSVALFVRKIPECW